MRASRCAIYLGTALLTGIVGSVHAAEDKAASSRSETHDQGKTDTSANSVGAGGLTGSGATQDGARTGISDTSRPTGSSGPAAGTAR